MTDKWAIDHTLHPIRYRLGKNSQNRTMKRTRNVKWWAIRNGLGYGLDWTFEQIHEEYYVVTYNLPLDIMEPRR